MAYKNKEKERQNKKEYYQRNKERIQQYKKKYYLKNREEIQKRVKLYHRIWYQKNKRKRQQQIKEWCRKNKERVQQYHKSWYQKNREKLLQQSKAYYQKNKERVLRRHRNYNRENKEKILPYKRVWKKYKRKTDPKYRLDENMRTAISVSLKGKKAGQRWETLVNYTLKELMEHLEKQFNNKMSWDNYGSYWAVDHVKPKSLFNYISPNDLEFKQCWSLKNLQPLEKIINIKKRNHLIDF